MTLLEQTQLEIKLAEANNTISNLNALVRELDSQVKHALDLAKRGSQMACNAIRKSQRFLHTEN